MARKDRRPKTRSTNHIASMSVRLDESSMRWLVQAAELRGIEVSQFVRLTAVPQARREVQSAQDGMIVLTRDEQIALWQALHEPVKLTAAQRKLSAIMRGN